MAEVSNFHRFHHQQNLPPTISSTAAAAVSVNDGVEEEDVVEHSNPFAFDFDSFSPPNSNPTFFIADDYNAFNFAFNPDSGSEYNDSLADPNYIFYNEEEDDEQMNFVTDLFDHREAHVQNDPVWEFDSGLGHLEEDPSVEFGFGPGFDSVQLPSTIGLRVVDMDSDSDSGEFEVSSLLPPEIEFNYGVNDGGENITGLNEEFEWEEVNDRIQFDERENLNSVIDRIEEITVSSEISSSEGENLGLGEGESRRGGGEGEEEDEEEARNIEWEVLLAVNNLERSFELDNAEENNDGTEVPRVNLPDDYILTMEYDALFGQLVENENALRGSPPAAKSVVEKLPNVLVTKEDMQANNNVVVCAVCKDDAVLGDRMTKMPCCHLYHGDCILPWLRIRNTCPVCRYELPTDDADYERRKSMRSNGRNAAGLVDDLRVRYNFELLP